MASEAPDVERVRAMNRELSLQVQDFKAGFEFLVRQMNDKRGIETDLIESRRRIAELESDLDAQKKLAEAAQREAMEVKAAFAGFVSRLSEAHRAEDTQSAELRKWCESVQTELSSLHTLTDRPV